MSPRHRAPGPPLLGPLLPRTIHEVNTAVWLREVSGRAGRPVTLADVPPAEWDAIVLEGVDCVWLMGVWERSPAGRSVALSDDANRRSWDEALPGWTEEDVAGSPYCVRAYTCAAAFGGRSGLKVGRAELAGRGARLIVDLVPNHVAPDHPLVLSTPDAFVRGDDHDLETDPDGFVRIGSGDHAVVVARGRDPYFPPWRDVVQLNAFAASAREFLQSTLLDIADQADGVRCDMAMLLLDDVFGATWGERAGPPLPEPLWMEVLDEVRAQHPGFLALAEAYWGREPDLLVQGFDACYDKELYDRLVSGLPGQVRSHVEGLGPTKDRTVRFLENHDEPRAAAALAPREREVAASVALATLPGVTLWHEGQLDARTVRLPVFLTRRPDEPPDPVLRDELASVIRAAPTIRTPAAGQATWQLARTEGWPDNASHERLLAWTWHAPAPEQPWSLVVVNLSSDPAQGRVTVEDVLAGREGQAWRFSDVLTGDTYDRERPDLDANGFFVDLPAWGHHVLLAVPWLVAEGNQGHPEGVSPP